MTDSNQTNAEIIAAARECCFDTDGFAPIRKALDRLEAADADSEALRLLREMNDDDYKAMLVWNPHPKNNCWHVTDAFIRVIGTGATPLEAVRAAIAQEQP